MWKKFFAPTILVTLLWIIFGGAAFYYARWLEESHAFILSEYGITIEAAKGMCDALWRLQALTTSSDVKSDPEFGKKVADLESQFEEHMAVGEATSYTPQEKVISRDLHARYLVYREAIGHRVKSSASQGTSTRDSDASLLRLANATVEKCDQLRETNEGFIETFTARRNRIRAISNWALFAFVVIGPAAGIAWGFRMSRHLGWSLAQISITLSGAANEMEEEMGRIDVDASHNVTALHEKVQLVATRLRHVMEALQQERRRGILAGRLAVAGELAAGVAHEIRNPLTSVKLLIQTAIQRNANRSLTEKQARVVQEEIARMENIIQRLLDFARPPQIERVRHDLFETLARAVTLVEGRAAQQSVVIRQEYPIDRVEVDADPSQLHQVFVNLLLNGIEAMADGGELRVSIEKNDPAAETCSIVFRDVGMGFPSAILDRVFEPFVTGKERGTGLGLAISYRIVKDHGGRLFAANGDAGGAVLTVELPTIRGDALPSDLHDVRSASERLHA